MIINDEIIQISRGNPQLNEVFFEELLSRARKSDLIKFIEVVYGQDSTNIESAQVGDNLMFSPKFANEISDFFNNISQNLDTLFYGNCRFDSFSSNFYNDIELASNRLESGENLKPELRLELQPSAYSGFDDKFSQQDYANILFVIAIANYARNKSQQEIDESRFINVLELMNKYKTKQEKEISNKPEFKPTIPHPSVFKNLTLALNFSAMILDVYLLQNSNSYYANHEELETMKKLELGESVSRTFFDNFSLNIKKPNTIFLLFTTSLLFASESIAEIITNKNLIKSISNYDEPISIDNRLLVDGIRLGLFFASQFDKRFGIDEIADRAIQCLSSLGSGIVNCTKSLFKSREEQDLESGSLLENREDVGPNKIKALAKEFGKLLAKLNEIISDNFPQDLIPNHELRVSRLSLTDKQQHHE